MRERETPLLIPSNSLWGGEHVPAWSNTKSRLYRVAHNRFVLESENRFPLQRCITEDIPGAYYLGNGVILNDRLYLNCSVGTTSYSSGVYRYDLNHPATPPVRMEMLGQCFGKYATGYMTSNGTHFYFTEKAGNEKRDYVISKYAIEGKTLRYVEDIVCGDTPGLFTFLVVRPDETIFAVKWTGEIHQFSPKGELMQSVTPPFNHSRIHRVVVYDGDAYVANGGLDLYLRRIEL
jgi:hypothetical protein